MINSKDQLLAEMKDLEGIVAMYKEAFPDNPAFAVGGKKKKDTKKGPAKQPEQVVTTPVVQQILVEATPQVDVSKVVEDALKVVADAIIMANVQNQYGEPLPGVTPNISDALNHIYKSFENLAQPARDFLWVPARDDFVEKFSKLANRSQTQVGHDTRKSFAEIHDYIVDVLEVDTTELMTRTFRKPQ